MVVTALTWAKHGNRFTLDFEAECAWLLTVAIQKTLSGFLHVAWRTAGAISPAGLPTGSGRPCSRRSTISRLSAWLRPSHLKGHMFITVVVEHERCRVIWAHDGYGKDVFDLFFRKLADEQRSCIRVVTGTGRSGSTRASMSGARARSACSTGSTSSTG